MISNESTSGATVDVEVVTRVVAAFVVIVVVELPSVVVDTVVDIDVVVTFDVVMFADVVVIDMVASEVVVVVVLGKKTKVRYVK